MLKKFKLIESTGKAGVKAEKHLLDAVVDTANGKTIVTLLDPAVAQNRRIVTYTSYADFEAAYIMERAPDGEMYHPSDTRRVVWQTDPLYAKI